MFKNVFNFIKYVILSLNINHHMCSNILPMYLQSFFQDNASVFMWKNNLGLGQRRLEVRCYGTGQVVLVDIHVGRVCGYSGNHSASPHTLWRSDTNWQKIQRISNVSRNASYSMITLIFCIHIYRSSPQSSKIFTSKNV